jgi:hypothetical protein
VSDLPFAPGCHWHDLVVTFGPPNVKWCEQTICAWVNEPANAWSNLAYIAVAVAMQVFGPRTPGRVLRFFPIAVYLVGLMSFTYHATNNYLTQLFDFLGMYLFCYLLLMLNARRLGRVTERAFLPALAALVVVTLGLTLVANRLSIPIQALVFLLIVGVIATEAVIRRRRGRVYSLRWFYVAVALLVVAATFSVLDVTRTWCDPTNHWIQGHALWHVLTALALGAAFRFHTQFGEAPRPVEAQ